MRKRDNILYAIMFGLLMVVLFASLVQQQFTVFKFRPLTGYEDPTPKPKFNLHDYQIGDYQYDLEQYVSENLGFREPIIRMYNQYVYDFYRKTYSHEVAIENDGWLYHTDGLNQYFGWMQKKLKTDNETFAKRIDIEARSLKKIHEILKEYGIHLMAFTLPTKTYLYPQHLKSHHFGDTTFNATTYYESELTKRQIPYINMNSWLKHMQDTLRFDLFPQKGSHWAAGAPLAVDTMLRMMETIGGCSLVNLDFGDPYPVYNIPEEDKDLEMLLNLYRPQRNNPVVEYPVTLRVNDSTQFPSALFVGTSFYWYMKRRVDFNELFKTRDFLFYGSYLYTNQESVMHKKNDFDLLWELLTHDYVVYFKNGPQLYMDGFFFAGKALVNLCIDESRFKQKQYEVADSLRTAYGKPDARIEDFFYEASLRIWLNPELFEELRGDSVPTMRNPQVDFILKQREIINNPRTKALVDIRSRHDNTDFKTTLVKEVNCNLRGFPSLLDNLYLTSYDFFDMQVQIMTDSLWHRPHVIDSLLKNTTDKNIERILFAKASELVRRQVEQGQFDGDSLATKALQLQLIINNMNNATTLANMKTKAAKQGKTLEQAINDDAIWVLQNNPNLPQIDHEQMLVFWEYYLIEHRFRASPQSMDRIRQKAIDKDKPMAFAIIDDVLYNYEIHKQL